MKTTRKLALLRGLFRYLGNRPYPTRRRWAAVLGWLAPHVLRSRAHIVRTNLALCFPERSPQDLELWLKHHFQLLAQSVVDRGLCWFGPASTIINTTPITGLHHLETLLHEQRRIILLAPHFIGLDAAATRLTLFLRESATLYTRQRDPAVDQMVREGRGRFNTVHLIGRHDGVRGLVRRLRSGVPVYYLPDMDFGIDGAAFVPFFNIKAATLTTTAQLAGNWNAAVVPVISRLDLKTGRYHIQVMEPLPEFPGNATVQQATQRLNALIEEWVRVDPAQYYWVHRRFKTRPDGEERFY